MIKIEVVYVLSSFIIYRFCGALLGSNNSGFDKTICSKRLPFMVRFISDAFEFVNEANQAAASNVRNRFLGVILISFIQYEISFSDE